MEGKNVRVEVKERRANCSQETRNRGKRKFIDCGKETFSEKQQLQVRKKKRKI